MSTAYKKITQSGQLLVQVLVVASVAVVILGGLIGWAALNIKSSRDAANRELAFEIAEGGIEYYRWHLAHAQSDYRDGTGLPGPYVHDYKNKDGIVIGSFTLNITPPPIGSTIVTIRSTGTVVDGSSVSRTIQVRLAIPSFAKYAVVADETVNQMRFGSGTEVFGPIHSNGGIRFDGLAHNVVSSAKYKYVDPDHGGSPEFGVHTHVNPVDTLPPGGATQPPPYPPSRPDVFEAGRQVAVPGVDFLGITADLSAMQASADPVHGHFLASGAMGYHIVLKTNDTFDLYKVNTLLVPPSGCTDPGQTYWGTWSISPGAGSETLLGNHPFPSNGIIFVEDNLWVDGKIDGARLTIVSARFPSDPAHTNITVNKDLLYTNYDGSDVLALIAQNNFNIGLYSSDIFRIDAAIMAQNGRAGRYYYYGP